MKINHGTLPTKPANTAPPPSTTNNAGRAQQIRVEVDENKVKNETIFFTLPLNFFDVVPRFR